jgi:hypothetical protein
MHRRKSTSQTDAVSVLEEEGRQRRLYSWLVLCEDRMFSSLTYLKSH